MSERRPLYRRLVDAAWRDAVDDLRFFAGVLRDLIK